MTRPCDADPADPVPHTRGVSARAKDDDASLRRLGGGRWQTRDERFTIEPESGTWVVVDAEQTDELGLPLVRGPFRSLADAKAAITGARTSGPGASPLAGRLADPDPAARGSGPDEPRPTRRAGRSASRTAVPPEPPPPETPPVEPAQPRWLADLAPAERGRARRQIEALAAAGIAAELIAASPAAGDGRLERLVLDVVALVAEGRDGVLATGWRLVDIDGRPIELTARTVKKVIARPK